MASLRSRSPSERGLKLAVLILILLLATCLRLHQLDADSLWGDEVVEVLHAKKDLASILGSNPLALGATLTHVFIRISEQDFLIRFPYAAFGILSVILMYQVGRALFDDSTGIAGAFLLAISPFHIQYSQEARSYSLTVLLVLASLYCIVRALQDNQLKHWGGFALLTALSLGNHVTAGSVVASETAFAALVLLLDRLSGSSGQWRSHDRKQTAAPQTRGRMSGWLLRLRASRGAMLIASALVGSLLFLVLSGAWFRYLSDIGVGVASSGEGSSDVVLRSFGPFVKTLLRDISAGQGLILYLFGAAFVTGLVSCAMSREWRQLLLAPIWIVPPFLILSRVSASAYFSSRHLIFILPMYLLFAARGITGASRLATRFPHLGAGSKRLLQGACILLLTGTLAWLSVPEVQKYYQGHKADWKGAATLLRDEAGPDDLVVQLMSWPTDPIPYYLDTLPGGQSVRLVTIEDTTEGDFPASVWWVLFVGQPGARLSPLPVAEELVGTDFAVYSFYSHPSKSPAVVRRKTPIADRDDLLQTAAKLVLVQTQADSWRYFERNLDRLGQITDLLGAPPIPSECPPELLTPDKHIQTALEQYRDGQRRDALGSTLTAMAIFEMLYPGGGRPHDSVVETLYSLGDSAFESGHQACSVLFYSRAADAYRLDVGADPNSIDASQKLADALVKAERHEEAVAAYERLVELAPDHWEYYDELAKAYRANGQRERDINILEHAVERIPDEPRLRRALADAYFIGGKMGEAASAFQRILEAAPEDIEARFGLAWAYAELGRNSEASREFRKLIEINPDHWLVPDAKSWLEILGQ